MRRRLFPAHLDLVETAITVIRDVQRVVARKIRLNPYRAFAPLEVQGRNNKKLLGVDFAAESEAADMLRAKLPGLRALGEESLTDADLDLSREESLVVLMDMVDGTDLLERGLSNWCSAMIFFHPPERRILGAFVGLFEEGVYYATEKVAPHFRSFTRDSAARKLTAPPSDVEARFKWADRFEDASIAYYGQKNKNFLSLLGKRCFAKSVGSTNEKAALRIYNFAGNPMMMKVIDGYKRIDAVFDVHGQHPHDVAPGAYIASRVDGVVFTDISGARIDLAASLLRPAHEDHKLKYVLAGSHSLAEEIRAAVALEA